MSTVTIADAGLAPQALVTRTRLRITARGRRVLAGLAALPVAAGVAAAILGGGVALGTAEGAPGPSDFGQVTVMSGETLWSIAERVAPGHDPRDVVAELSSLNALEGGVVQAGQQLSLPVAYSAGR